MFRYFATIWDPSNNLQVRAAASVRRRSIRCANDWQLVFEEAGIAVFCAGDLLSNSQITLLPSKGGVVLGTVFESGEPLDDSARPEAKLGSDAGARIVASRGADLLTSFWGRYVAFLFDAASETKYVIKDPTGRFPCYESSVDGLTIIFSCLRTCLDLKLINPQIDWTFISTRVGRGRGDWGHTGLQGVRELIGGARLTFSRSRPRQSDMLWNPRQIAATNVIHHEAEALPNLRCCVRSATATWTQRHPHVLCRLSGGLDSSIVLACIQNMRVVPKTTCITYEGGEGVRGCLPWATRVAGYFGLDVHAQSCRVHVPLDALDHMEPLASPPPDYSWAIVGDFEVQTANARGATAVVTGDGGDSIFGRYSEVFAFQDYVGRHGFKKASLAVAANVALLRNRSFWSVLSEACLSNRSRPRKEDMDRLRKGRSLVKREVFAEAIEDSNHPVHPWFMSTVRSSVSDMVDAVASPDLYYHPLLPPEQSLPEIIYPLCSQPLIELCLRIPSYIHMLGGRSRGLARKAFEPHLPPDILYRQWKDTGPQIADRLIQESRYRVREYLLDGLLVKHRLLDRAALIQTLDEAPSRNVAVFHEVTDHVLVEAWLQSWAKLSHVSQSPISFTCR